MRKEPILAIVLGSFVGVVFAFGVWKYTQTANNKSKNSFANEMKQEQEEEKPNVSQDFSLLKPINNSVVTDPEIIVSGLADSNSIIAIIYNSSVLVTKANEKGEFEENIEIDGGNNNISVYSFAKEKMQTQKASVVYSSQVEQPADGKLTLMSGTVTDISEKNIQIKTTDDIIEQISVEENTTYVSTVKAAEDIEFSEIALGDFITAIGSYFKETNGVLNAQRIIVSNNEATEKLTVVFGTIKSLSSSEFIVKDYKNEEYSIDATGKVSVTKIDNENNFIKARLKEANENEQIIIIGEIDEELEASRIHIFPIETSEE